MFKVGNCLSNEGGLRLGGAAVLYLDPSQHPELAEVYRGGPRRGQRQEVRHDC